MSEPQQPRKDLIGRMIEFFFHRRVRDFDVGNRLFAKGRFPEAVLAWKRAADKGHLEAAALIGDSYFEGRGVLRSLVDAKRWYEIAANGGVAKGQVRLAELFLADVPEEKVCSLSESVFDALCPNGAALERNDELARKWGVAAAEQGDVSAQAIVGYLYASGRGGPADYRRAEYWYRQAIKQGDARAQLGLGILLAGEFLGEPDYAEALRWFMKAVDQNNPTAMFYVAIIYKNGHGVDPDPTLAFTYFKRAAALGNFDAQRFLGSAYEAGKIVRCDLAEAEAWYRKAANRGDVQAMVMLADMLFNKCGESLEALEWHRSAAEKGHIGARTAAERIAARMALRSGKRPSIDQTYAARALKIEAEPEIMVGP